MLEGPYYLPYYHVMRSLNLLGTDVPLRQHIIDGSKRSSTSHALIKADY